MGFAAMGIGGFTAGTDLAARTVGPMVCPDGTSPHMNTYETTTTDDYGNSSPATGFEMQCLDRNQKVVKTDPIAFSFYWIGVLIAGGVGLAALLAFLVAGPAGLLIARLRKKNQAA
jgi:hypothetical protein